MSVWINQFKVKSSSGDREYVISQHKFRRHWACSCRGWSTHRKCKHLEANGLPAHEVPFERGAEPASVGSEAWLRQVGARWAAGADVGREAVRAGLSWQKVRCQLVAMGYEPPKPPAQPAAAPAPPKTTAEPVARPGQIEQWATGAISEYRKAAEAFARSRDDQLEQAALAVKTARHKLESVIEFFSAQEDRLEEALTDVAAALRKRIEAAAV